MAALIDGCCCVREWVWLCKGVGVAVLESGCGWSGGDSFCCSTNRMSDAHWEGEWLLLRE